MSTGQLVEQKVVDSLFEGVSSDSDDSDGEGSVSSSSDDDDETERQYKAPPPHPPVIEGEGDTPENSPEQKEPTPTLDSSTTPLDIRNAPPLAAQIARSLTPHAGMLGVVRPPQQSGGKT